MSAELLPALYQAPDDSHRAKILETLDLEQLKPIAKEVCGMRRFSANATAEGLRKSILKILEAKEQVTPIPVRIGDTVTDGETGEAVEITSTFQAAVLKNSLKLQQGEYAVQQGLVEIAQAVKTFRDDRHYLFFGFSSFGAYCNAGQLRVMGDTRSKRWANGIVSLLDSLGAGVLEGASQLIPRSKLLQLASAVQAEAIDGAARGAAVVFGVILGTGVGGGIVVNGQVLTGANAIGGEWGHNFLPWPDAAEMPGPECYCGRLGCIESFLSGPALARQYARKSGKPGQPSELAGWADSGDPVAETVLEDYAHRLARALASVINLLDPDVIVLGGGLSNLDRLYTAVPSLWAQWVFSDRVDTRLVPNLHGDSSGVRGAAWLWPGNSTT